ncbi:MAG: O-antigen ligase family protein, partial [Candidatus Heimdallarchaeota archaeon]
MFFIFFGTRIPFAEKVKDVEDITTSNIVNQIVFSVLLIISLVTLVPQRNQIVSFFKREKFFLIFFIWSLLSIFWSQHPFVSTKRFIQFFTSITVSLAFLTYTRNSFEAIKILFSLLAVYVTLSLISVFIIPMAKDPFGLWRGLTLHKNLLGQMGLISLVIFSYSLKYVNLKGKFFASSLILISLALMIGSRSSTSILTLLIVSLLSITLLTDQLFEPIGIGKVISTTISISLLSIIILIFVYASDIVEPILGSMGKDFTFTGRVQIWKLIWEEAQTHFLTGAGFQGFWVTDTAKFEELFNILNDIITQSHNGYLDIFNELGLIGAILFFLVLINYFVYSRKLKDSSIWNWFVLLAVIINLTETNFITPRSSIGVMFIFSYFAMFSDLFKQKFTREDNIE